MFCKSAFDSFEEFLYQHSDPPHFFAVVGWCLVERVSTLASTSG